MIGCGVRIPNRWRANLRMEFPDHILFWKEKDLSKKLGQYAGQEVVMKIMELKYLRVCLWSLVIGIVAVGSIPADSPASDSNDNLAAYVMGMEQYKQYRGLEGIPGFSKAQIKEILEGELVVQKADINDKGLRYVLSAQILDIDPVDFWLTIIDRPHYADIIGNITESIVSRRFSNHFYTYNVLDAPLVAPRHQVLDVYTNAKLYEVSGGKVWEQYWHKVDDMPAEIKHALASPNLKNIAPGDVKDAVEVKFNRGSWYIYALPDGRTWAESFSINDPGGKIPQWVVNSVSSKVTKTTFDSYSGWAKNNLRRHMSADHQEIMAPNGQFMAPSEIRALLAGAATAGK
jgi:hypothetical protein